MVNLGEDRRLDAGTREHQHDHVLSLDATQQGEVLHAQRLGAVEEVREVEVADVVPSYDVAVGFTDETRPRVQQLVLALKRQNCSAGDGAARPKTKHSPQRRADREPQRGSERQTETWMGPINAPT